MAPFPTATPSVPNLDRLTERYDIFERYTVDIYRLPDDRGLYPWFVYDWIDEPPILDGIGLSCANARAQAETAILRMQDAQ